MTEASVKWEISGVELERAALKFSDSVNALLEEDSGLVIDVSEMNSRGEGYRTVRLSGLKNTFKKTIACMPVVASDDYFHYLRALYLLSHVTPGIIGCAKFWDKNYGTGKVENYEIAKVGALKAHVQDLQHGTVRSRSPPQLKMSPDQQQQGGQMVNFQGGGGGNFQGGQMANFRQPMQLAVPPRYFKDLGSEVGKKKSRAPVPAGQMLDQSKPFISFYAIPQGVMIPQGAVPMFVMQDYVIYDTYGNMYLPPVSYQQGGIPAPSFQQQSAAPSSGASAAFSTGSSVPIPASEKERFGSASFPGFPSILSAEPDKNKPAKFLGTYYTPMSVSVR